MEIRKTTITRLQIISGKCVCVQMYRPLGSHQLVAENLQENEDAGKVTVYDIKYPVVGECMAFCFKVGGKSIFPVTDGKEVKCKELQPNQEFTKDICNETFLFKWRESATYAWRILESVANPNMYLFVKDEVTNEPVWMQFQIKKEDEIIKHNTKSCMVSLVNPDSNRGPSCRAALSFKSKCHPKRKTKKMKTFVKS